MIKKSLFIFSLLTTLSVFGFNKDIKIAKADNTPLDNLVESGYITQNFVNSNGYVDLSTNEKFQRVSDYYTVNRLGDFTTVGWNTAIMDVIFENKTAIAPEVFHKNTDEDNLLKVNGQTTAYWATDGTHGGYYSLISQKVAVNMVFNDWNTAKEQPLEFVFALDEDFDHQADCYFQELLYFLKTYTDNDFTLPILQVDGQVLLEISKTGDEFSYHSYDSRIYLGYGSIGLDSDNNPIVGPTGEFFVELPFRNYIQTIEVLQFQHWTDEEIFRSEPVDSFVANTIWLDPTAASNSKFSPFGFSNLDFKNGQLTAISGTAPLRTKTTFGYITDYFNLDYIVIDDELVVYTKPTELYALGYGRELVYELYSDINLTKKFDYNSNSSFIKKLKASGVDVNFNITYYSYRLIFNSKDLSENLHDLLTDSLRPTGYNDKPLTSLDLEEILGFNPRPRKQARYANTEENENKSAIVDCGNYYLFSYKADFDIHEYHFETLQTHDFGLSRLFFKAQDITSALNVRFVKGVMFYYQYQEGDNADTEYSLAIVTGDMPVDGAASGIFGLPENQMIKKSDNFGSEFTLRAMTGWEVLGCLLTFRTVGSLSNTADCFAISTPANVKYKDLCSLIYCTESGDIVNLSAFHDKRGKGYTGVVGADGKITIIDINGNKHPGYHFDEETGVLKDYLGQTVHGHGVGDGDEWWRKLLAVISVVAVVGGVAWVISKVGPTFAIVFSNRKKRKK